MLGLNQMKNFIYLLVFLVGFSVSSLAWGGVDVSAHFGMKFGSKLNLQELTENNDGWVDQKNMPWQLGADVLYRHMMGDTGSFGVGIRYRLAFTGEKDYDYQVSVPLADDTDKYKFTHHRIALLANYRFHLDQFFVGPVLGLDIWKSLKFSGTNIGAENPEFTSNQFLWNNITGHAGLELGYQVTDNLSVKLETGYDLSSFGFSGDYCPDCTRAPIQGKDAEVDDEFESKHNLKLNAFYVTLGVGWFFG